MRRLTSRAGLAMLPVLVLCIASASAAPSFVAGTPVSVTCRAVALGDVTGDGRIDLLTNNGDLGVYVLPGNGNATFGAPTAYSTPYGVVTSIAVGRLDADELNDLVFTSSGGRCAVAAMNGGGGAFGAAVPLAAGLDPRFVLVADLLNTGNNGIAVANTYSNTVSFFPGNGNGTFGAPVVFGTAIGPRSLGFADFDLDGRRDVALACNDPGAVTIVAGSSSFPGQFSPRWDRSSDGPTVLSGAVGNFNGDIQPDMVVTTPTGVRVFENYGTGNLQIRPEVWAAGATPLAAQVADFDGDGNQDVVVANFGENTVSIFPGNGDGTFGTRVDYTVASNPWTIAIADLDGDGDLDLAVGSPGPGTVSVLLNQKTVTGVESNGSDAVPGLRPNPFRGSVSLEFVLASADRVSAEVYDPQGRLVRSLAAARPFAAGRATLIWDGRDEGGAPSRAGLYLVRVQSATGGEFSRKVELLR